jgi:hypothetical protein
MRFATGFILIIVLAFPLYYFMPWWWWSAVIPAALLGFGLQMNSFLSFLCGLLSIGLFWLGMAYWSNASNDGVLLAKLSSLLPFGSATATLIGVAVLGGILGGLAMLSAKLLRDIVTGPIVPPTVKGRGKYK